MTGFHKIMAGAALSALMAGAAIAQTTPAPQAAVKVAMDGTSNIGTGAGETVTATSEAFVGNPVLSAEGDVIGSVAQAATTDLGTLILVDLDPALGFKADGFTVTLAASEVSDGQIELGYSKGELMAALNTQLETSNSGNG